MISFLTGTDHFRLRLREQALAADFCFAHAGAEQQVFDGRDTNERLIPDLRETLSGGLFATPRVVLIRHIELFDEKLCAAIIKLFSGILSGDGLIVVSAEPVGRAKKGNELQVWLAKQAVVEEVNILSGRALTQSISDILQGIDPQATIEPRAVESLALRTGGVTGYIYHDLLKLVLAAEGKAITETDVKNLVEEPAGESVSFVLLEQIVRGQRERAVSLLRREETNDDAVFKLLGLFAWQVRQALMVRDEYERGVSSPDAIAATIGAKPFSVRKLMPLINQLPLDRLKRALAYLADLDQGIKTGQIRPGVALDLFVWKF
ncbi:MAG: DNA polymerase III subunit delta [Candidatus Moraniibacteriota bacterium]